MNDDDLTTTVKESVTGVHMTVPVDQIISRGRVVRARRRIPGAVSGLAVVTAAAVVLGLGLSGAFGSAPARGTGTIRTAAFTLAEHANGTATLTLTVPMLLDPRVLQRDLRQDGIPAVVRAGSFCTSQPIPSGFTQVVSGPNGPRSSTSAPAYTINPAAMPAGTELSFGTEKIPNPTGYANRPLRITTFMELIDTNSYTCSSALPEPWPQLERDGQGAGVEYIPGRGWMLPLISPAGS